MHQSWLARWLLDVALFGAALCEAAAVLWGLTLPGRHSHR